MTSHMRMSITEDHAVCQGLCLRTHKTNSLPLPCIISFSTFVSEHDCSKQSAVSIPRQAGTGQHSAPEPISRVTGRGNRALYRHSNDEFLFKIGTMSPASLALYSFASSYPQLALWSGGAMKALRRGNSSNFFLIRLIKLCISQWSALGYREIRHLFQYKRVRAGRTFGADAEEICAFHFV